MDLGVVVESGEPRAPPDIIEALTLDCLGLSTAVWPPSSEPSRGFLGGEGIRLEGLTSRSGSPRAPRAGGGICPLVSCHARDLVKGVGNSVAPIG